MPATDPSPPPSGPIAIGQRLWLQRSGRKAMGLGIWQLLVGVDTTGSLRQAAAGMGMAYSKAWYVVRRAEETLGVPLVARHAGGRGGGGSCLSPEGRWLMVTFGELVQEADRMAEQLSVRYLADWPGSRSALGCALAPSTGREHS